MVTIDFEAHEKAAKMLPESRIVIGGVESSEGSAGVYEHVNPSTGRVQAEIPMGGASEINRAVEAAQRAFDGGWGSMRPAKRRRLLTKFAALITDHLEDFAQIAPLENGVPISAFRGGQFSIIEEYTNYYAGWADKISGQVNAGYSNEEHFEYSIAEPYGVVAHIITWNAPALSLAIKIPACLAAGNTVVIKPSEITPFSAVLWVRLAQEAGIPDGVVNVVTGSAEAGEALVAHPGVGKISFTGGLPTAQRIMRTAADPLTPVILELGGKGPNLFFEDADFGPSVAHGAAMCMGNTGQGCTSPSRLIVAEGIYEEVIEGVKATLASLVTGDPLDPATGLGPVVNEAARVRILATIAEADEKGWGKLVVGGNRIGEVGNFIEPTLFIDTDNSSPLAQKEIFGPVLVMMPFKTESEAVALANNSNYGLTAWIQSRDVNRVTRLVSQLHAGNIVVNPGPNALSCPNLSFGGVKMSGIGREGGKAGLDEYLRTKAVSISKDVNNFGHVNIRDV